MKISKAFRGFLEDAKTRDLYWIEKAKLDFAVDLDSHRKAAGMTYKAIAEKIGTSAAYITKVFRGDTNMTIETMVKLARSTGGELDIRIVNHAAAKQWGSMVAHPVHEKMKAPYVVSASTVLTMAANHAKFDQPLAA